MIMDRSSQMFTGDQLERQKLGASVYILTPGVPFMYYGEEIGLKGSRQGAMTDANRRVTNDLEKSRLINIALNPPIGTTYNMANQVKYGGRRFT